MRVISGRYGSRPLKAVPGQHTRPTTDKIKENIFNLLEGNFNGGWFLDLYGGTGAIAIEAVSRGMDHAVICEKYRPAIETIKKNITITKESEKFTLLSGINRKSLEKNKEKLQIFDLVMIDPPYDKDRTVSDIEWLAENQLIDHHSRIVCESDSQTRLPDIIGNYVKYRHKTYGLTGIHLYRWKETI